MIKQPIPSKRWAEVALGAGAALAIACALSMCSGTAKAALCEEWSATDTALAVTASALTVADWLQTQDIVRRQTRGEDIIEINPILGLRPSRGAVNKYFLTTMVLGSILTCTLSSTHRKWLLGGVIALESAVVLHNRGLGLSIRF